MQEAMRPEDIGESARKHGRIDKKAWENRQESMGESARKHGRIGKKAPGAEKLNFFDDASGKLRSLGSFQLRNWPPALGRQSNLNLA